MFISSLLDFDLETRMFFSILDDDLAPTPESQVENRRHIRLRERERFDPRKRGSLEEFVDRLRNEVCVLFFCFLF